jgi:hypothetical protein
MKTSSVEFHYVPSLVLLVATVFLSSCDKGELPVPPRVPGNVQSDQVQMGTDYREVIYYDLHSGEIINTHLKTDWDLGFESVDDGWTIRLNTSKAMRAAKTDAIWFSEVTDTSGVDWGWDVHSGNSDSTAIGDWRDEQKVYIIDLGYSLSGLSSLGFIKVRLEEIDNGYRLIYANLSDVDSSVVEILKDPNVNYTSFSFKDGGAVVDIEPNKEDWQLKFTVYTHLFEQNDRILPYSVTGVLINPYLMTGLMDSLTAFEDIDLDFATSQLYSNHWNTIGYDWKEYSFNLGSYTVLPEMIYLLKSKEGYYWKLHFVDFYDSNGDKGSPAFEYQEL